MYFSVLPTGLAEEFLSYSKVSIHTQLRNVLFSFAVDIE